MARACEGQMSLKQDFFLWKTSEEVELGLYSGLVAPGETLAGGNIRWLGQPKDQKTAFFEPDHRVLRSLGLARPASNEKAGRLHRHI